MNPDYEKHLEREIDEALKALPELSAPKALSSRVLSAIARGTAEPWYRRSWEYWPAELRYGALAVLVVCFGAFCFASWQLTRAAGVRLAVQEVGQLFSGVFAFSGALLTVLNGLVLALKHVHPAILLGSVTAFAAAWALAVGLGTACAKLALARR